MIDATDRITSMLVSFLDVQSQRAQLAASNIANADTPGYMAKELDFADYLRQTAYEQTSPSPQNSLSGFGPAQPVVYEPTGNPVGIDGNTVDMGHEMSTLGDAGMQYLAGVNLLQARLRILGTAIKEGK